MNGLSAGIFKLASDIRASEIDLGYGLIGVIA